MWLTREDLPDTIRIEDRCYRIDTDFRSWIRFELILSDDSIDPYYKTSILINALEVDPAIQRENQEDILRALFSFYRMGKPSKKGKPCKDIRIASTLTWILFMQHLCNNTILIC